MVFLRFPPRILAIAAVALVVAHIPNAASADGCPNVGPSLTGSAALEPDAAFEPGAAAASGATPDWWSTVSADLGRAEYAATTAGEGLQAPNRAQGLRTYFRPAGFDVVPRTQDEPTWRFQWRTVRWGRAGAFEEVDPARSPQPEGARVTYDRGALVEWYVNRPEGLEQGFTVNARPAGEGPLRIVGALADGLRPELRELEGAVDFVDGSGVRVLRYGDLHVEDARGRSVPSHFELEGDEIALVMDDAAAEYPLTVDPMLSSPAWTTESDQTDAKLGTAIATAGDVNGDGYSDVIIGISEYDTGVSTAGRADLFLGSASGLSSTPAWTKLGEHGLDSFGASVAAAGDVNGDGYADVVVGAPGYPGNVPWDGGAFVFLGSPSGLASLPAWTGRGNLYSSGFGQEVSTAGDVNGDGYSDIIVAAPWVYTPVTEAGRAFVYHGGAAGPSTTAAWTGEGDQAYAHFGYSVGAAGDVDADGYGDVVVGAGGLGTGSAYVYRGSASGLASTPVWTAAGTQSNDYFGHSVAGAGDVNGDGYADVVVGAPGYNDADHFQEGNVFLYLGSASGLVASSWHALYEPDQAFAFFGISVATAGDVNGDGYADVIAGARWYNGITYDNEGGAFIYLGSPTGLTTFAWWSAFGGQASAYFGEAVATAGDVNGDGYSDVIVGAPGYTHGQSSEGRAFVFLGAPSLLETYPGWTVSGDQDDLGLGTRMACAGDVNGDGYSDVIVGAPDYDSGATDAGRAYVYQGSALGLETTPSWIVDGDQASGWLGAVGTAGDVNGDGYSDVVVGAPGYTNGQVNEGRAHVYLGSPTGLSLSPAWTKEGNAASAFLGSRVRTAGDVNGDGYSDVLVTSHGVDRVRVYLGSASGLATTAAWTGQGNSEWYGWSVASAGDVNGDGYSDVMVGAPYYGTTANHGRVLVYLGSAGGLSATADWTREAGPNNYFFGEFVDTAGDVNGDGYSDVIIGDASGTNGQSNEGQASVYLGSASGLALTSAWSVESNQDGASLGPVATAGDVNGDGYSDVIVGVPRYDWSSTTDGGVAHVYLGSASGLAPTPYRTFFGPQDGAQCGSTVAGVGDVNGDGFADLLVGTPGADAPQHAGAGQASLWYGNQYVATGALPRAYGAHQVRADGVTPIALLGLSDSPSTFVVAATGHSAAGRARVRLEVETKAFGTPFDGLGLENGVWTDTGAPTGDGSTVPMWHAAQGLSTGLYHWRVRVATDSPFFPARWLTQPGNAATEADLRLGEGATDAPLVANRPSMLRLEPAVPNPFAERARLAFALPHAGSVRLAIYDVTGREIVRLLAGVVDAGRHVAEWSGRDGDGRPVAAGVYFARLTFDGENEARKIVLVR